MFPIIVLLVLDKLTKNAAKFVEQVVKGQPPVMKYLYLPQFFVGDSTKATITVHSEPPPGEHLVMRHKRNTKACAVYEADIVKGVPPTLKDLYLPLWKIDESVSVIYVEVAVEPVQQEQAA